jgi:Type IV secretion-system coupling protein DNA-binding domain
MDEGGVLLVNLSKGQLGEDSALVLGGFIASTIGLAAFSRADSPPETRRPFFLYMDEFQNFTTLMMANMMSELRKYGVGLVLAHQYFHQLDPDIRHAVLGNAGTLISFRVGPENAAILAREFQPTFGVEDLLNLPNYSIFRCAQRMKARRITKACCCSPGVCLIRARLAMRTCGVRSRSLVSPYLKCLPRM